MDVWRYAIQETDTSRATILQFRQDMENQFRRQIREALDGALRQELAAALAGIVKTFAVCSDCRHGSAVNPSRTLQRLSFPAGDHQSLRVALLSLRCEPA